MEKDKLLIIKNTFLQEIPNTEYTLTRGTSAPVSMSKKDSVSNMCCVEEHPEEDAHDADQRYIRNPELSAQTEISRLLTGDIYLPSSFPSEIARLQTGDVLPPPSPMGENGFRGISGVQTWQHTEYDLPGRNRLPLRTGALPEEQTSRDESSSRGDDDYVSPPSPPDLSRLVTGDYFEDNWMGSQPREQGGPMMQRLQQEHAAAIDQVIGQVGQMSTPMMIPVPASSVYGGGMVQGAPSTVPAPTPWTPCYVENVAQEHPMPAGLERSVEETTGAHRITWSVDARKLRSTDRQIVSPLFYIEGMSCPFKLLLFPVISSESRGGASFKNAGGKGFVQLKCEGAPANEDGSGGVPLVLRFFVGSKEEPRGPIVNDFHEQPVCGLPQNMSHWDLAASAEKGRIALGVEVLRQTEHV